MSYQGPTQKIESPPVSPKSFPKHGITPEHERFLKEFYHVPHQPLSAQPSPLSSTHSAIPPSPSAEPLSELLDPLVPTLSEYESTHPPPATTILRQEDLFTRIEAACTVAARDYYRSQRESPLDKPPGRVHRNRGRNRDRSRRAHPYQRTSRDDGCGQGPPFALYPIGPTSLADHLPLIADLLWQRATAHGERGAELEAVHRMGNLYAWAETIIAAARASEEECAAAAESGEGGRVSPSFAGVSNVPTRGYVTRVIRAGRDLASWLLSQNAKEEIEALAAAAADDEGFWVD